MAPSLGLAAGVSVVGQDPVRDGALLGLLGIMFTVVQNVGRHGVSTVTKAGSMLFVPRVVVHAVLFSALFYGFASSFDLWPPQGLRLVP